MVMSPIDLRGKEFRKAFRGYAEEEVEDFMEMVIEDYETLFREHLQLKDQLAHQEDNIGHYRGLEDTLKSTLVIAQKTAEDMRASVEKEVSAQLENARKEAEIILKEAEAKAAEIIRSAQARGQAIVREYGEIQKQAQVFKLNMRSLLNSQLEMLNQNYPATEAVYEQGTALEQWVAKEQGTGIIRELPKDNNLNRLKDNKENKFVKIESAQELSQDSPVKRDILKEPRYNPEQQEAQ